MGSGGIGRRSGVGIEHPESMNKPITSSVLMLGDKSLPAH